MNLYKGQIIIKKKKITKNSLRFFLKSYLKKNYSFFEIKNKKKYIYELIEEIKIDNLYFNIVIIFYGIKIKCIKLRSIENISENDITLYKKWIESNLKIKFIEDRWISRHFKWGKLNFKFVRINRYDVGCITVTIIYN